MAIQPVLIAGAWRASRAEGTFQTENPATTRPLDQQYPVSSWADLDLAIGAAADAARKLRDVPDERVAMFLELYAAAIERYAGPLVAIANQETALAARPRLAEVELPRTANQLREAARAARRGDWRMATIDSKLGIRSCHEPIGPVIVFGPNNFPLAFNGISGGDFAAAIASGNPVIAKANTSHPGTTQQLALLADQAARQAGLPPATVQLVYRTSHDSGRRAVADPRVGATGYTGSRRAGLELKDAADGAGRPIYLELSSINPVIVLPGALEGRGEEIVAEFTTSCLMGTGQFCTNPGLVILLAGAATDRFVTAIAERFRNEPIGTLLSKGVQTSLAASLDKLASAGAKLLAGGTSGGGSGYSFANSLLSVDGNQFLANSEPFQTEAFGNASLVVIADEVAQASRIVDQLEGNLTGTIYSDRNGADDAAYDLLAPRLRAKVGRLLNDKMPTGVAVSSAMNHGGPYPATGHPGFTAVGIPAALLRFTTLACYDNVRQHRLPPVLRDKNPTAATWRLVDGEWTQDDVRGA